MQVINRLKVLVDVALTICQFPPFLAQSLNFYPESASLPITMNRNIILALTASLLAARALAGDSISVINPSFQADNFSTFPGYVGQAGNPGAITGWSGTGGRGINGLALGAGSPFADNGIYPDNNQSAFIQGAGSLSQSLSGFTIGDVYWVQGFANARACCGDIPAVSVSLGGSPLLSNQPLTPVEGGGSRTLPWYFVNLPWTATAASGDLTISSVASVGGDASVAIDGISVIRRTALDIVIANPSFEASGNSFGFPGYIDAPNRIAGWTRTGGGQIAINGSNGSGNPFADNGIVPDGGNVVGLQQDMRIEQVLSGLTTGQTYRLSLDYNSRSGDDPTALFQINGITAFNNTVSEVGGANAYYHFDFDFVATGTSTTLALANLGLAPDSTLLVDNVRVQSVPEPGSAALLALGALALVRRRRE